MSSVIAALVMDRIHCQLTVNRPSFSKVEILACSVSKPEKRHQSGML